MTPRYAGISTFCRYPRLDDVSDENRPLDWIIYGAPYDSGVTYRPGARFGPRAVREESQYVKPYHLEHEFMLTAAMSICDAGDAPVSAYNPTENADTVTDFATALPDVGRAKLFMVGGDHSNTLANLRATYIREKEPTGGLAMIHFDSHLDTVDSIMGERYSHASPFIRAIEEGILDPKRMISVGIKGPLNSPADLEYARTEGIELVTHGRWLREGRAPIDAFLDRLGDAPCYLTFDIDCVDPVFAPGTGTPAVGGFTSSEALELLRGLVREGSAPPNIVGADVVEVLPQRDVAGCTALLAAHVMFEILCVSGLRTRAARG